MNLNPNEWYFVKSVAGGSVLLAMTTNPPGAFPYMNVTESYDMSSLLCGGGKNWLKDYNIHLAFCVQPEMPEDFNPEDKKLSNLANTNISIIQFIERI